ncbi:MAG: endolytic transglycosylase MltG [Alphaproteobacteria bacterium]|nr:endolytic transglycosylase MltG [Alphaproteobacteria bacterium]
MKRIVILAITALVILGVFCGGLAKLGYDRFTEKGRLKEARAVVIPSGQGLFHISTLLEREGIVKSSLIFRLGTRFSRKTTQLKAGEFLFPAMVSAEEAMQILIKGETVIHSMTIAEGLTTKQILKIISKDKTLVGEFTSIPKEGSLLPETYHFSLGDTRDDIIRRMTESMESTLDELWSKRIENLPFNTKKEAVILASIVERGTAIPEERGLIASVFINRLVKRMRLQTDPTVIYALSDGLGVMDKPLSKKNLKTKHPYNTYTNYGLPPGAICNSGRDSIVAVLNPESSNYLYFVADGTGGHVFAKTLKEHNNNVKKWRKIEKRNNQK